MRGSEKRVIFVRDTGSQLFEEAYFIVRRGAGAPPSANDMVTEAQRIVSEASGYPVRRTRNGNGRLLPFLAGAASAGALIGAFSAMAAWL